MLFVTEDPGSHKRNILFHSTQRLLLPSSIQDPIMAEEATMSSDLEATSPDNNHHQATTHHHGEDQADAVQTEAGDANHGLGASEQGKTTEDSNAAVDISSVVHSGQQAAIDVTTNVEEELVVEPDGTGDRMSNGSAAAAAAEQGKTTEDSNHELSEDVDASVDVYSVESNGQRVAIDATTNVEEKVVVESDGAVNRVSNGSAAAADQGKTTEDSNHELSEGADAAVDVSSVETNGQREATDVTKNVEEKVVVESDGAADRMSNGSAAAEGVGKKPELKKDTDSRTFTMRELLDELKKGEGKTGTAADSESERQNVNSPSYGLGGSPHQQNSQNNNAMELINSVTGTDEEGRSRQRVLTYAAKRYASTIERNPEDYDALYNWALVLQESADNVGSDSTSPSKDALLDEACKKYDEATSLCPTLHDAFYNWAIAVSDRAKMRGRTKEAEELWKQATEKYEKAVQLNWNSPQALNNWGLALQELSAIVPAREKQTIVKSAISKFRAAIQLQFDFHRAIYNLGTVLYGLAEDLSRLGATINLKDVSPTELYSQSAIYIAAAHSLKPSYSVYTSALKLVRSMLPLPYLKVGYLTAPPKGVSTAPHSDWKRTQFVLNHEGLLQIQQPEEMQTGSTRDTSSANKHAIKINVVDIISMSACADLTLPPGAGLCINTTHGSVYLVDGSWDALDAWVDAIRLVYTIFARGKSDILAGIITG